MLTVLVELSFVTFDVKDVLGVKVCSRISVVHQYPSSSFRFNICASTFKSLRKKNCYLSSTVSRDYSFLELYKTLRKRR